MSQERPIRSTSGSLMLPVTIAVLLGGVGLIVAFGFSVGDAKQANDRTHQRPRRAEQPAESATAGSQPGHSTPDAAENAENAPRDTATVYPNFYLLVAGILVIGAGGLSCCGFFTLQPNEGRVLILFGAYKGTVRASGFHWTNPFMTKKRISLRARNLNGEKLKVNDRRGNPIEIAVVVVWHVHDTAQACFDVDQYAEYVEIQSESAVRHLANCYAYDHGEEDEITLRSGVDEVSSALQDELQARLAKAGVVVEEARLTHLAYAPEIAGAMLRRQQAEAIIDARQMIVHGAVSMVEMALHDIAEKKIIELDDERKAAMISNLLVVLCGETEAQPVINAGTLYG